MYFICHRGGMCYAACSFCKWSDSWAWGTSEEFQHSIPFFSLAVAFLIIEAAEQTVELLLNCYSLLPVQSWKLTSTAVFTFQSPHFPMWLWTPHLLYHSLEAVTTIYKWRSSLDDQSYHLWDFGAFRIRAVSWEWHKIATGDLQQDVEDVSSERCVLVILKLHWNYSLNICSGYSLCILTEFVNFKSFLII